MKFHTRLISIIAVTVVFCLVAVAGNVKTSIDKEIEANVYIEDTFVEKTTILISGTKRTSLFPTKKEEYVGIFSIAYHMPTCKEGVEAKIQWHKEGYQDIIFFYAGDFLTYEVRNIKIDESMEKITLTLEDGTTITTEVINR